MSGGSIPPSTTPLPTPSRSWQDACADGADDSGDEFCEYTDYGVISYGFDAKKGAQCTVMGKQGDAMEEADGEVPPGPSDADLLGKMQNEFRYTDADPTFDPEADDEDETWHREAQNLRREQERSFHAHSNTIPDAKPCTAHLSCPCCFETVSVDCKQIGTSKANIWKALCIPMGCGLDTKPGSLDSRDGIPSETVIKAASEASDIHGDRGIAALQAENEALRWWTPTPAESNTKDNAKGDTCTPMDVDSTNEPNQTNTTNPSANDAAYPLRCGNCSTRVGWYISACHTYVIDCAIPSEV